MWKKRPRTIPSDFDPVYPYEREPFIFQAPFVNTDRGLTTDPPGFIAIKTKNPLGFDNQGRLELKGDIDSKVNEEKGLTKSADGIEVKIQPPLTFNNNGEITFPNSFDGNVSINQTDSIPPYIDFKQNGTRKGFIGFQSLNSNDIRLNSVGDIWLDCGRGKDINSVGPFMYVGTKESKLGAGIRLNNVSQTDNSSFIAPVSSNNLTLKFKDPRPNTLSSRFSTLDFENQTKIINCPEPSQLTDLATLKTVRNVGVAGTLWTGSGYRYNASAGNSGDRNMYFFLALTSVAGHVTGTFILEGKPGTDFEYLPIADASFTIKFGFDNLGNILREKSSINTTYWGLRQEDDIITRPSNVSFSAFMPSYDLFNPMGTSTIIDRSRIIKRIYFQNDKKITLYIWLNKEATGYSIWFEFLGVNNSELSNLGKLPLAIGPVTFSYVAQSQNTV